MHNLTCEIIYDHLTIDQLYRLGILLASYDMLSQQIALRNHIDKKYGVISTDYMQRIIECENLGKKYPKALRRVLDVPNISKDVLKLCSILPVDMFYEVQQALIKDDEVTFDTFGELVKIKEGFNKLTRSLV